MNRTALFAFLALFALPAPALAHAHLESAKPASGARLTIAPRDLVLTFSEAPALAMSSLRLLGPDSTVVALGAVNHDAGVRTIGARVVGPLVAGRYTVLWETAGDDGHVQHGSYQFVIAEGAEGLAPVVATTDSTRRDAATASDVTALDSAVAPMQPVSFDVSSPVYVAIRWVQFVALLLLIGAVAFRWWLLPRTGVALDALQRVALAKGAAGAGSWGAWLLLVSAIARLLAQGATLHGPRYMADFSVLGPMLTQTAWGHGWLLEIVAVIVAIVCLRIARHDVASTMTWRIIAAATAGLAFVPALSGHAIAERTFQPFTVLLDGAHVLAAGAWLGGLAVILFVGLPVMVRAGAVMRDAAQVMVNAFSPLALTCAGVLVFSGIVAARLHLGSWSAFTGTTYGETLLVKLALVVVLLVVAAWNWRRVKPTLAAEGDAGVHRLARSGRVEVGVAVLVLLVTAVLVALPAPMGVVR